MGNYYNIVRSSHKSQAKKKGEEALKEASDCRPPQAPSQGGFAPCRAGQACLRSFGLRGLGFRGF